VKVGALLRETMIASAFLAAIAIVAGLAVGRVSVGLGLGAGLIVGSLNGHLVLGSLHSRLPFVAASVGRMVLISAGAILLAMLLGSQAWSVLLGVAGAQAVMVAAAVRQGLRT
jgi:hypothetical protein